MGLRTVLAIVAASLVCGCAGAVHQLPIVSQDQVAHAQSEVEKSGRAPARHAVSDDEALAEINAAVQRIRPAAAALCREMAVGVCDWRIMISKDRSMNASAGPNGVIVVNRGIVEYAENEEEIAMVIAHEMGHQSANHLAVAQRNQMVGALIGGVLLGAVGALASSGSSSSNRTAITARSAETGMNVGATVGRISYSKEQEREADYLSALTLYRSGMDLDKARGFLVIMARASKQRETGMLDTHPAGPERLAAWDKAVEQIKASNGALPKRN